MSLPNFMFSDVMLKSAVMEVFTPQTSANAIFSFGELDVKYLLAYYCLHAFPFNL